MTAPTEVRELVRRRWQGTFTVDGWGLDADLLALAATYARFRWDVVVSGADHLPTAGPAVVVFGQRLGVSEPGVAVRAVHLTTGRPLRVAGVVDVGPLGTLQRRLGGVLSDPDEVHGLLRVGELVGLGLGLEPLSRRPGRLDAELLAPALEAGVPVLPMSIRGRELGRRWRVAVGPPVLAGDREVTPADLADLVRSEIAAVGGGRPPVEVARVPGSPVVELVR